VRGPRDQVVQSFPHMARRRRTSSDIFCPPQDRDKDGRIVVFPVSHAIDNQDHLETVPLGRDHLCPFPGFCRSAGHDWWDAEHAAGDTGDPRIIGRPTRPDHRPRFRSVFRTSKRQRLAHITPSLGGYFPRRRPLACRSQRRDYGRIPGQFSQDINPGTWPICAALQTMAPPVMGARLSSRGVEVFPSNVLTHASRFCPWTI